MFIFTSDFECWLPQSGPLCVIADKLIKSEIYSDFIQVFIFTLSLISKCCLSFSFKIYELFFSSLFIYSIIILALIFFDTLLSLIFNSNLQEHLAPSGYLKLPNVSITLMVEESKDILRYDLSSQSVCLRNLGQTDVKSCLLLVILL